MMEEDVSSRTFGQTSKDVDVLHSVIYSKYMLQQLWGRYQKVWTDTADFLTWPEIVENQTDIPGEPHL